MVIIKQSPKSSRNHRFYNFWLLEEKKNTIERTGNHEKGDFFPLCSLSGLHSILMPHGGLSFPLPQPSDSEATTDLVFYY